MDSGIGAADDQSELCNDLRVENGGQLFSTLSASLVLCRRSDFDCSSRDDHLFFPIIVDQVQDRVLYPILVNSESCFTRCRHLIPERDRTFLAHMSIPQGYT